MEGQEREYKLYNITAKSLQCRLGTLGKSSGGSLVDLRKDFT